MYYPNLKTSDSEMRALKHLDEATKKLITPVFELTRSRITKTLPEGSIVRRMEQLVESYGSYPFVLDLCTEEDLMNSETEEMFDEDDGYGNWQNFLEDNAPDNVIPCVLYVEEGDKSQFVKQALDLHRKYGRVCLRTSAVDEVTSMLFNWLTDSIPESDIILCGILYFIEPNRIDIYEKICASYMTDVVGNRVPSAIAFPASSFPKYITDMPGCEDGEGSFEAQELVLETKLKLRYPSYKIVDSDFASVHPIRYKTGGGNWIPRIDVFDGESFVYSRTRRGEGGYLKAAGALQNATLAKLRNCWGAIQIKNAKSGILSGKSPSYWISVRINCWITSRANT